MRSRLTGIAALLALAGAVVMIGCKEEGPAEKAGKNLDKSAEKATKQVEEATEDLEKAAEDLDEPFSGGD